jgi:hypothetical protein
MKIFVVFEFPEISDVESTEADYTIQCVSGDIQKYAASIDCDWYIDDVTE